MKKLSALLVLALISATQAMKISENVKTHNKDKMK